MSEKPQNKEIETLGAEFARYIAAFMDGENVGEPEFDDLYSPLGLGRFLAAKALGLPILD